MKLDLENLRGVLELCREFGVQQLKAGELEVYLPEPAQTQQAIPSKPISGDELRERYAGRVEAPADSGMESPYEELLGPHRAFPGME